MTVDWQSFSQLVHDHQRFILTSHIRPDCDALGSELGMAGVLRAVGKDVLIVNGQETPPNLEFIDPENEIRTIDVNITEAELADREVLIVLDTSAWVQLGAMADVVKRFQGKRAIVDHHVSEDDLQATPFKNTKAEATGRLVMEAAKALDVQLTQEMATPLFAAIATDTGWFRFPSASDGTYRLGAELIEAGAKPPQIFAKLYERDTAGRVRLRGQILARLEVELDGRLVHAYVEGTDFEQLNALPSDTEDVINMTLAVQGTEVAVICIEQPQGGVKVSFRSRGKMDCSEMAGRFGGGGHKAAAGAFLDAPLEQVRSQVLAEVRHEMAK